MTLYFFQNCISPHQMPYIEALSQRDDIEHVWVVAPRLAYNDRAAMGWPVQWTSSTEKMTIKIVEDKEWNIGSILSEPSASDNSSSSSSSKYLTNSNICFFSGITAFKEVEAWFKQSLKFHVKRGIITEAPYTYDKPLWMHKIKFLLKDYTYIKYIDYIFAIGEDCAEYYKSWSKRWKVVDFLYCTNTEQLPSTTKVLDDALNLCFVGSLDRRKNVKVLLEALALLKDTPVNVTIVGDGPERVALEEKAKSLNEKIKISFVGSKPMDEVQQIVSEHDVLVLPSLHDGWGAVINEAMSLGTIPVCSNKCGAKSLIKKSGFGKVFDVAHPDELAKILLEISSKIKTLRAERQNRSEWARENISPKAVAQYLIDSL